MRVILVGLWFAAAGCRAIYGLDDPQTFDAGGGQGTLLMHALAGDALFSSNQTDGNAWAGCQTMAALNTSRIGTYNGSGPGALTLTSLGVDTTSTFSVWFEGSVYVYDVSMSFELAADDYAFVDISYDHGVSWNRVIEASPGDTEFKTVPFPAAGAFYSIRAGWTNLAGQEVFLFDRKSSNESAYASWKPEELHYP